VSILLSVLTWKRCAVWKDTGSLFGDVIKKHPDIATPYNQLGLFSAKKGELDEAIKHFKTALSISPDRGVTRGNLERAYRQKKSILDEKRSSLEARLKTVEDISKKVELLNELGVEQGKAGNLEEAISLFNEAVELDPDFAESYNNLGYAYYMKGEYSRAEEYFRRALEIDPGHEKARRNLNFIRGSKKGQSGPNI